MKRHIEIVNHSRKDHARKLAEEKKQQEEEQKKAKKSWYKFW